MFLIVSLLTACGRGDKAPPELLAISRLVLLSKVEMRFMSLTGRYGTLQDLGPQGANLILGSLARGSVDGYKFEVIPGPRTYVIHAHPIRWKIDGRRTFYSDQTGIIRQNWTDTPATSESEELQ